METIFWIAWGVALGVTGVRFWRRWKREEDAPPPPRTPISNIKRHQGHYKDCANGKWMVDTNSEGQANGPDALHSILLMDIRGAIWEVRDEIKANTAYLKQVYGEPDDPD